MRPIDADALRQGLGMADDCRECSHYKRSCHGCSNELVTDDFCYAIDHAPTIEPEPRWIPCSERLPEPRTDVWTCSDIGQIQGYYEENVGVWYASFGQGRDYLELIVTAWMPLPAPYREEVEQDDDNGTDRIIEKA